MSNRENEIRPAGSDETTGTTEQTLGATDESGALERDPQQWVSGDDPMTPAQRSYLDTLAKEAGEELPGCRFAPRCRDAVADCTAEPVWLTTWPDENRSARCIRAEDLESVGGHS